MKKKTNKQTNKQTNKTLLLLALLVIAFYSCKNEIDEIATTDVTNEQLVESTENAIVLGKKLNNPYSVANMQKAYNSLLQKKKTHYKNSNQAIFLKESDIQPTDYYVKFWVENDDQKNFLIADSLHLSNIPLDVEILEEGNSFVDEETEIEEAQWVYTSVTKEYQFRSEIKYEKIEDLFLLEPADIEGEEDDDINDEEGTTVLNKKTVSNNFLLDLEDEALRITNNQKEKVVDDAVFARRRKKRPEGRIMVRNTVTNRDEPVVGVKVKTRRWFKWGKGWTNQNGDYSINRKYRRDVNYTVVFKNSRGFKIWPSTISISSARYRAGKHNRSGHNITFSTNSVGWRWSTVNNATVKYLDYCTQFGIGRPHSNLRIVANGKSGGGAAPMLSKTFGLVGFTTNSKIITFLSKTNGITLAANKLWLLLRFVLPDIIIKANASQGTGTVFNTTFHELAHASHFAKAGNSYWIKYINYIITYGSKDNPYGNGSGKNSEICGVGEMWGNYYAAFLIREEFNYTTPFDRDWFWFIEGEDWYNPGFLKDINNIPNITTPKVFNCLNSSTNNFNKLIQRLKTKTEHDDQIDHAFSNYTDWPE